MRFVIVTGMSGAGKMSALKMLEEAGYFCVDNLPIALVQKFAELSVVPGTEINKVALGLDIRSGESFSELEAVLTQMEADGFQYEILFMDAADEVLLKRYKETRSTHPLAGEERIEKGIATERDRIQFLKNRADFIIDTSNLLIRELKQEINHIFVENKAYKNLFITILSFGFKSGIPADADLVFDVRFLPNPYYIDELKKKSGNDPEVQEYVMSFEMAGQFLDKLEDMLDFLIPNYIIEGKHHLVIGIGCTGGKHRSVTLANRLYSRMCSKDDYGIKLEHRDIEKDAYIKGH